MEDFKDFEELRYEKAKKKAYRQTLPLKIIENLGNISYIECVIAEPRPRFEKNAPLILKEKSAHEKIPRGTN